MTIHKCFKLIVQTSCMLVFTSQALALQLDNATTALADYVQHDDGIFKVDHVVSIPGQGYTAHLYNLISQQWLTEPEVDKSIWSHSLVIVIPDVVASTTSLLYVGSGDNDDAFPDANDQVLQIVTQLALASQTIASAIYQVPNQPIIFDTDGVPRKEDDLVARSWKKALDSGNYIYPAYLPMVKSVVKAMDAIQSVVTDHGNNPVDDFVLTGFSKRGAAVWLTAAVDSRVKAIAPGVIDFLNIAPGFDHHYRSYGGFSYAIDDYAALGITQNIRSPEFRELSEVIDPYSYLEQLSMPKFLLNSSGDQFFLPDSSRFYFDELLGEKHIRFSPNTSHSLNNSITGINDTLFSLLGWYQSIIYSLPRPAIDWQLDGSKLLAKTSINPQQIKLWRAHNPLARDFRKSTIGEAWQASEIAVNEQGEYSVDLIRPAAGFSAAYIEFIYTGATGQPVTYSTQVYVTPDEYPFALEDAINNPQHAHYWVKQIRKIYYDKPAELTQAEIDSYLPVPLFDKILHDIHDLKQVFSFSYKRPFSGLAERECLATRLNIRSEEMGWYSNIDLGRHFGSKPLWQHYQMADEAFESSPLLSRFICYRLNK